MVHPRGDRAAVSEDVTMQRGPVKDGREVAHLPEERELEVEDLDFGDSFLEEVVRTSPLMMRRLGAGERLGGRDGRRFEILEPLGEGAMGQVFRARDEELQRVVALKLLFPREEHADLSLREARAIAKLDHENIVRIFDVSEWSVAPGLPRVPFLVMECLEGESLAALLARERLALPRALELMRGVAAGLAHAHSHHVIHRDLKPSNIFLTTLGGVKLLDFGLAWVGAGNGGGGVPHLPMAGTPPYMAPEQWRGAAVDARTDVWAAGVVLFEMLTGELPYPSHDLEELRARVLSPEPVPLLRERRPELPWEVEALVSVMLAKEPAQRLLTAAELGDELRELEEHLRPGRRVSRAVAPQRRQVTLVSCRLEGLVELAEVLDPEDFGELEAAFQRRASLVLQRQGGFITLCMGDEVLACFGYPLAREEDSERAVRAGLALPEAVHAALRERLPPGPPPRLAVQVGIHTDMVVLDDILPELSGRTLTIQGEAPRVAAWVARQAGPDEVLVSQVTDTLVRRAFETRALGPRSFEGRRDMVVLRVECPRRVVSRFERVRAGTGALTPLVGREEELRRLLGHWEAVRGGQGCFVLVSGEAGIGKSRLIEELRERVGEEQALWVRMQCWASFGTSAFHPVIEALQRSWLRPELPPRENLRTLELLLEGWGLSPLQRRLLAALLGLPVAEDSPHLRLTPERRKEELLEALSLLLLRSAEARPVVWVVEDLHWADPSTLQFVGWLLERVEHSRVLGVFSARPEFRPPWTHHPCFHVLALERLQGAFAARMVKEAAGGRPLSEELLAQLVERTEGIPLFAEEMTRAVLEQGPSPSIPVTLRELLLARLDALPRRQKELAELGAVVGRSFSPELLTWVTGAGESSLRRDLVGLVTAGLLLPPQEELRETDYQFRHALIQEAAWQSLPRRTRREYHRRIARALEEHFPEVVETQPEVVALHYTEAGVLTPAIRYWRRAGLLASQRSANQEAVSHLHQALRLLRSLPESGSLTREELQLLLALGIPLTQVQGYGSPEVARTYARVRELFREVGDSLPHLELNIWGAFAYYFARTLYSEAHEVAELLVDLGQRQGDRELLALGHRMMATTCFAWGRMAEALMHTEEALRCSDFDLEEHRRLAVRDWVNPRVAALAYGTLVLSAVGQFKRAECFTREALELAERIDHPHTLAFALTYCAVGCQLRDDARQALVLAERGRALSSEHRFLLWLLWCNLLRSWALSELGRPQEALVLMRQGLERWERMGPRSGKPHNLGMLASIHLRLGQAREGLALVEQALEVPERTGERNYSAELHRLRGELLRRLGREAEAREAFLEAIRLATEQEAQGYARRARESLEHLLRHESPHPTPSEWEISHEV